MSDADANDKKLSDIELCYKAMGLSFSDNPQVVEKVYRKLKDDSERQMHSSDPAERLAGKESLKQLEELFATITESLIYKDYAREYEKYKAAKAEQMAARKQKQPPVVKEMMVNCPYCNKLIIPKLKVCLYCHGKILTPMEQLMEKLFSRRNLIVMIVVVALVAAGVVLILNPQLFKR